MGDRATNSWLQSRKMRWAGEVWGHAGEAWLETVLGLHGGQDGRGSGVCCVEGATSGFSIP